MDRNTPYICNLVSQTTLELSRVHMNGAGVRTVILLHVRTPFIQCAQAKRRARPCETQNSMLYIARSSCKRIPATTTSTAIVVTHSRIIATLVFIDVIVYKCRSFV